MFSKENTTSENLNCEYITQCSGCQIATLSKSSQIEFKKNHFSDLWRKTFAQTPEIEFFRPTESQFRDRIDLTIQRDNLSQSTEESFIEDQKIGFYKKDSRDILDIESCPLLSEASQKLYKDIRKINFPIHKGSLRLRTSPSGLRGVWIDFSNEDIKKILDEKITLDQISKICDVIEVGQKRKKLSIVNGQYKLTESEPHSWFETYDKNMNPVGLQMNVGSFSQTGFSTNKVLINKVIEQLKETIPHLSSVNSDKQNIWLELCSGSGNLTVPLISFVDKVIATELDENAVESLKSTAKSMSLSDRLHVERINIHKPSDQMKSLLANTTGILADPPRSGLQGFLEVLAECSPNSLPKNFIYVSCFAETLISDIKYLERFGYKTKKIIAVDQFPHSTHCEWVVRLQK